MGFLGQNNGRKDKKQQQSIKKYIRSYVKDNKNNWKKAAIRKAKGDRE